MDLNAFISGVSCNDGPSYTHPNVPKPAARWLPYPKYPNTFPSLSPWNYGYHWIAQIFPNLSKIYPTFILYLELSSHIKIPEKKSGITPGQLEDQAPKMEVQRTTSVPHVRRDFLGLFQRPLLHVCVQTKALLAIAEVNADQRGSKKREEAHFRAAMRIPSGIFTQDMVIYRLYRIRGL